MLKGGVVGRDPGTPYHRCWPQLGQHR